MKALRIVGGGVVGALFGFGIVISVHLILMGASVIGWGYTAAIGLVMVMAFAGASVEAEK